MVRITFIDADGAAQPVEATVGQSLMQAAIDHGVRGVVAECGGASVCGTCHCHIDEAWLGATGPAGDDEQALIAYSEHLRPNSRLGCQVPVTATLDGLVVRVPPSQP